VGGEQQFFFFFFKEACSQRQSRARVTQEAQN
jgi:hypothetical protein